MRTLGTETPIRCNNHQKSRWLSWVAIFIALFGMTASLQGEKRKKATAKGECAVAHSGNNDVITIRNCGIGTEQADKIVEMLKVILANQRSDSRDAKLDELLELARKAVNPYGTTITYQPDGRRRKVTLSTGTFMVDDGGVADFKAMMDLQKYQEWQQIIVQAKRDLDAYPGWFTPDEFIGEAELRLCRKKEASEALTRFINETGEAPAYAQLRGIAQKMLLKLNTAQYGMSCGI